MKINIICVGKIKESYFRDAIQEYMKRLSRYVQLEITEVRDEKAPDTLTAAEEDIVKKKEGEKILKHISAQDFLVCLEVDSKQLDSVAFADFFEQKKNTSVGKITFVIGGSLGLSKEVLQRADFKISFSKMTFPHQLMRVILLEQIYRAMRIISGEPYHK